MKFGTALAGMALTLIGAAAQAQLVTVALTPDTTHVEPAGVTGYNALFTFNGPAGAPSVTLNQASFSGNSRITAYQNLLGTFADGTDDPNLSPFPITLNFNNPSDFESTALELNVPTGVSLNGAFFSVSDTNNNTYSYAFSQPSAVPEPGSIALLASSVIGGGLFVSRRRRK